MSLVVEPTLPWSHEELQLNDTKRWSRLFPLMRPSIKNVDLSSAQTLVIDPNRLKSKDVLIAAVLSPGNFPSKILSGSNLAAFTIEESGKPIVSSLDILKALREHGFPTQKGVVVVRSGSEAQDENMAYLEGDSGEYRALVFVTGGDARLDHTLSLLSATKLEVRSSFEKIWAVLDAFKQSGVQTRAIFDEKKVSNGFSIIGLARSEEFSSAKECVNHSWRYLLSKVEGLDQSDATLSIHFSDINGLSRLEDDIVAHELSEYFAKGIKLPIHLTHSTILDSKTKARGWNISVCRISSNDLDPNPKPTCPLAGVATSTMSPKRRGTSQIQFVDSKVRKIITAGCDRVIKEEPTITEYDTKIGDGDCGYTLRDGAKQVLFFIQTADLSSLPSTLSSLVDDLEVNMGGTSGALYCIFLSSLAQNLWDAETFAGALEGALNELLRYTRARLGDRTCLDCLIPFVETLGATGDGKEALSEAKKGVVGTEKMEARFGRSSYLDESATRGVPDPGAYGLLVLLEGMIGAGG